MSAAVWCQERHGRIALQSWQTCDAAERFFLGYRHWSTRPWTRENYEVLRAADAYRPPLPPWEDMLELLRGGTLRVFIEPPKRLDHHRDSELVENARRFALPL